MAWSDEGTHLVTVAVWGTGSVGHRHLAALRAIEGVEPVAVPMRSERLSHLEQAGFRARRSLEGLGRPGMVRCIVATDTGRHVADVLEAIDRGFDVLVEKPLAVDARDGRRLADQAAANRRQVFVGCVLRFSESLQTVRAWMPQVGRLHAVRIECRSYLPDWRPERPYRNSYSARAGEGGVLRDLIHDIDYAGWLFGWPGAVQARVRNLGRLGIESEEVAELGWDTPTGCLVSVHLDYLTRPAVRQMKACGERGTLEWDGIGGTVTLTIEGAAAKTVRSPQTPDEMFIAQARAFINAHREPHDPRLTTATEGVRALAVCDAARRSSDSRLVEPVTYE